MDELNTVYEVYIDRRRGIWLSQSHPMTSLILAEFPSKPWNNERIKQPLKPKQSYPPLFEAFWSEYHTDKRVGKKETFGEWKKLTPPERVCLPKAAKAYTAEAQLRNTSIKYIRHPVRFIKTGIFEDYANKGINQDAFQGISFWDTQFQATMGIPYPWKDNTREYVILDIRNHGLEAWKDKVWFFFAGDSDKVKAAKKELGAHYNTFRSLLTGPLAYSGLKRKAACKHCGNLTGHSHNCPVSVERRREEARLNTEVENGKEEGLSILESWKDAAL